MAFGASMRVWRELAGIAAPAPLPTNDPKSLSLRAALAREGFTRPLASRAPAPEIEEHARVGVNTITCNATEREQPTWFIGRLTTVHDGNFARFLARLHATAHTPHGGMCCVPTTFSVQLPSKRHCARVPLVLDVDTMTTQPYEEVVQQMNAARAAAGGDPRAARPDNWTVEEARVGLCVPLAELARTFLRRRSDDSEADDEEEEEDFVVIACGSARAKLVDGFVVTEEGEVLPRVHSHDKVRVKRSMHVYFQTHAFVAHPPTRARIAHEDRHVKMGELAQLFARDAYGRAVQFFDVPVTLSHEDYAVFRAMAAECLENARQAFATDDDDASRVTCVPFDIADPLARAFWKGVTRDDAKRMVDPATAFRPIFSYKPIAIDDDPAYHLARNTGTLAAYYARSDVQKGRTIDWHSRYTTAAFGGSAVEDDDARAFGELITTHPHLTQAMCTSWVPDAHTPATFVIAEDARPVKAPRALPRDALRDAADPGAMSRTLDRGDDITGRYPWNGALAMEDKIVLEMTSVRPLFAYDPATRSERPAFAAFAQLLRKMATPPTPGDALGSCALRGMSATNRAELRCYLDENRHAGVPLDGVHVPHHGDALCVTPEALRMLQEDRRAMDVVRMGVARMKAPAVIRPFHTYAALAADGECVGFILEENVHATLQQRWAFRFCPHKFANEVSRLDGAGAKVEQGKRWSKHDASVLIQAMSHHSDTRIWWWVAKGVDGGPVRVRRYCRSNRCKQNGQCRKSDWYAVGERTPGFSAQFTRICDQIAPPRAAATGVKRALA